MAQRKKQKGSVQWQHGQWTLSYWLFDHKSGKWKQKRERRLLKDCTDMNNREAALKASRPFMAQINELNDNAQIERECKKFGDFVKTRWASYLENRELQPSTLAAYVSMTNTYLLPAFGHKPMVEIGPTDITDFFSGLRGKLAPKYASNLYGLLNSMFETACQFDIIQKSPVRSKLHKPKFKIAEKPILTVDEVGAIVDSLTGGHRMLVITVWTFPVRLGEALGLRWADVDMEARELFIRHGLWKRKLKDTLKTEESERRFPIPQIEFDWFQEHKAQSAFNGPGDFVFCNSDGQPFDPDNLRHRVLYPVLKKLGIKRVKRCHGFHLFRHSSASLLHEETQNLKLVSQALGHSRISTTANTYVHLSRKVEGMATEILSNALSKAISKAVA